MPILDPNTLEFFSRSPEQTRRVGMRLGTILKAGDVIGLEGDLGSGKTTLVQGVAAGWGTLDNVSSPTFILINQYHRPDGSWLYHLDAYRLASPQEADELDLEIIQENGPMVVEWADQIKPALPNDRLWIRLWWMDDEQRGMRISGSGERAAEMVASLRQLIFGVA
jgi:tRNA threonylcarbamoyladenosine biosynthesis protein TsaE